MKKILAVILILPVVLFVAYVVMVNLDINPGGLLGPTSSGRIKNAPPKGYTYSSPSIEALERNITCKNFYHPEKIPAPVNPLCLNLYQTSVADITDKLVSGNYDRIILYGESFILDSPAKITTYKLYNGLPKSVYDTAMFTDRITIPVLMKAYGVKDISSIGVRDTRYPAIYTRVSTNEEVRTMCSERASGCSLDVSFIALPQTALNVWYSADSVTLKKPDGQTLIYNTSWPEDCYSTTVIIHEIAHAMQVMRLPGDIKKNYYFLPVWFREYMSGFTQTEGSNLICGNGTFTYQNGGDLIKFESEFPPADLEHTPPDNDCSQAVLVLWNRYLGSGNVWEQNAKFFTAVREQAPYSHIYDETGMVRALLELRGSNAASDRSFLRSHGCSY